MRNSRQGRDRLLARGRGVRNRRVRKQQQLEQQRRWRQQQWRQQQRQDRRHLLEPAAAGRVDGADAARWSTASSWRSQQAGNKAGQLTVKYTSLDDSTAPRASGTRTRPPANARKAATDSKAVYYIGEFNSGAQRGLDPDPQPGRDAAGQPREHVRRPDHQRARHALRASRRSTTRPGTRTYLRIVPRDSIQAAADLLAMKQAGCTKVAVANDKEAYGAGLADADRAREGQLRHQRRQQHRHRPDGAELPLLRGDDQGPGSGLLLLRRDRLQRRRPDHQGRQRRDCRTPRSSAATACAPASYTNAKKGGVPARIDPLIQCTVATLRT